MEKLADYYKKEIERNFWPFWKKAFDEKYGGVFTCFSNDGQELISHNKYTWSQGRFLWLCATLYEMAKLGDIELDIDELARFSRKTYQFLKEHTILPNGNILFITTEDGKMLEEDTSIFADGFFILGVNKYAAAFQDYEAFDLALKIYENAMKRIKDGNFQMKPYPIPKDFKAHSISMIFLNVSQEMAETARLISHPLYEKLLDDSIKTSQYILDHFILENGRIIELKPLSENQDTLLARHVNPGHALESVWFHLHLALKNDLTHQEELIEKMSAVTLYALTNGWDSEYGGLLRFVDIEGKVPSGRLISDPQEKLILDTHDTKLWWPHSEALYTTLLMYELTDNQAFLDWYKKLSSYVFDTFPHPDPSIGEWIQIRSRNGEPIQKVVALPVKDPFHILRNFIQIIDLLKDAKL